MVELVDTPDSKSGSFAGVTVRARPLVPSMNLKIIHIMNFGDIARIKTNFSMLNFKSYNYLFMVIYYGKQFTE